MTDQPMDPQPDTDDAAQDRSASGGTRRRVLLLVLAAAFVAAATPAVYLWRVHYRLRFAPVHEGVLYRSAQPDARQLERMSREHGIRTIVNLRTARSIAKDPRAAEEIAFAKAGGVRLINMPYSHDESKDRIDRFLAIVADPANRPVLVHCSNGKNRAGVMAAAYRVKVQGWPVERAMDEMRHFHYDRARRPEYQADLQRYCTGE